jgi:NADPH2 dehydrogenase
MHNLFSPIRVGHIRLSNRLVLQALPSGCAVPDGFVTADFAALYLRYAQCGVGLVAIEPTYVLPPRDRLAAHVGLYADAQVSGFHQCIDALHTAGAAVLIMLDQPLWTPQLNTAEIAQIGEAFVMAAWRARAAGADGVMLSTAGGGVFEQFLSPLRNHRVDRYGNDPIGRLQLLIDVLDGIGSWIGHQFVVGIRLNVEEFTSGGLTLQDSRTIATRLVSSGVNLIEVSAEMVGGAPVARFPGWRVPLAEGIKSVVDVPVMVGGQLDDPVLANSVIRDGSADLIAIGERLQLDPDWPLRAWAALHEHAN